MFYAVVLVTMRSGCTGLEVLKRMGDVLTTKFTSRETTLGDCWVRSSDLMGEVVDMSFPRSHRIEPRCESDNNKPAGT
jgi:hypothetical protein